MDASEGSLAVRAIIITARFHVNTLWRLGSNMFLWFTLAGLRAVYRNLKFGDPQLRVVNIFLLAQYTQFISFFFIFGAYSDDIFFFAKTIGFSIALNWGVLGPKSNSQPALTTASQLKPLPHSQPQPA